ncbi:MAG: XylR family transcriptional regulator [Patescibacteria group bacterium]|nr:XylR family transcriptional regulator [Patescibacteria group bacterium]
MERQRNIALIVYPYAGYDRALLRGIASYARHHGPWVFHLSGDSPGLPFPQFEAVSVPGVQAVGGAGQPSKTLFSILAEWGVDGVIGRIQSRQLADQFLKAGLPVIAMDTSLDVCSPGQPRTRIPDLRPDSHLLGRLGAEHFIERGFHHFAFCGYAGRRWSDERHAGFAQRLAEACFDCRVYEPPRSPSRQAWNRERPILQKWLASLPRPIGILAANDIRGRQVLETCHLVGAGVPNEVAVLGVDNDVMMCELGDPPLSSIALRAEAAGWAAAALLDDMMTTGHAATQEIVVEPIGIVTRRSTDVIAVDDPAVAAAMKFIRKNARFPIGVDDVAAHSGLSRRTLQVRFQKALGHPIREEIQRARLALARQMLLETDMPVWKVAQTAGFNSLSYLERVFRRATGISLARYRRRCRQDSGDATGG